MLNHCFRKTENGFRNRVRHRRHIDVSGHFSDMQMGPAFVKMLAGNIPVEWLMELIHGLHPCDPHTVHALQNIVRVCVGTAV